MVILPAFSLPSLEQDASHLIMPFNLARDRLNLKQLHIKGDGAGRPHTVIFFVIKVISLM